MMGMFEHIKEKVHFIHIGLSNLSHCPLTSFPRNIAFHAHTKTLSTGLSNKNKASPSTFTLVDSEGQDNPINGTYHGTCPLQRRIFSNKTSENFHQPKPMGCILSKPTTTTAHPQSRPQPQSASSPRPCHLKSYSSSISTLSSRKPSSNSLHHQKEEEDIDVVDGSESGTRFRDSQMEKYESAYKLLSSQSRRGRIEGILYHPSECTATRVDIMADQLWI